MPACGVPSKKIEKGNVLHRSKPQDITGQTGQWKDSQPAPSLGVWFSCPLWLGCHGITILTCRGSRLLLVIVHRSRRTEKHFFTSCHSHYFDLYILDEGWPKQLHRNSQRVGTSLLLHRKLVFLKEHCYKVCWIGRFTRGLNVLELCGCLV